mgnify:CR=1 FL=1
MYSKIVNPKTGRKVSVKSRLGKTIIRKYLFILSGGAEKRPGGLLPSGPPRSVASEYESEQGGDESEQGGDESEQGGPAVLLSGEHPFPFDRIGESAPPQWAPTPEPGEQGHEWLPGRQREYGLIPRRPEGRATLGEYPLPGTGLRELQHVDPNRDSVVLAPVAAESDVQRRVAALTRRLTTISTQINNRIACLLRSPEDGSSDEMCTLAELMGSGH